MVSVTQALNVDVGKYHICHVCHTCEWEFGLISV